MARTSVWRSTLLVAAVAIAGCNENLTTAGRCPALCPSGDVQMADTLLDSPVVADTSLRGYVLVGDAAFLLASSLDSLKSVILMRFFPVHGFWVTSAGDTVRSDSLHPDSVQLQVHIGQRDTAVKQLRVILYRLPAQFDTTVTYAGAQPYFADSLVVDTTLVDDTLGSGAVLVSLPNTLIAPEGDSGVISLGIRVTAAAPTALGVGSGNLGSSAPILTYYVHALSDTSHRALSVSPTFSTFVQSPDPAQVVGGVLTVGGLPSARSTLHLSLPRVVIDSNAIVRASLILTAARPAFGFARDSFYIEARPLLRDFGLKSILYPDSGVSGIVRVHAGDGGTVQMDIAPILRLWGTTSGDSLPRAIVLLVFGEGSVLGEMAFHGRAAGVAGGAPQLRVTYVKKYEFGVP